ncbi:hypothetical protein [Pseudovibrio flavus]|uniref:hypothetical protein n=1 Tax=Pseudovibrio flavus TaxID=2529854 RepID=UPI00211CF317|nr:hypothetical protein [Pseudovibrio flavus]
MEPITHSERIEHLLGLYSEQIGEDLPGYRNHIYRVLSYALYFLGDQDHPKRPDIEVALAFHDLGMWTDHDLAYLEPSIGQFEKAKSEGLLQDQVDTQLVHDIIFWHHKFTPFRGEDAEVVNAVRKGDWIDGSKAIFRKGVAKEDIDKVYAALPVNGFYDTLMRLASDLNNGHKMGGLMRVLHRVYKL